MLSELIFHHIGVAVFSIEETSKYYREAGYTITDTRYDPVQDVNICFIFKEGNPCIELIEPISEKSPVAQILQKKGVSPYHFCYQTPDIQESITRLKKIKFIVLSKPVAAVALDQNIICFLFNKHLGLIELVQI
ncbi:MAG: VOC family protein [Bacteroidota bacterium]